MAEAVVILAMLIWGGGLCLTVTDRVLLGALTSVAAWAIWLVFGITTHNQVGAIVAAVSLKASAWSRYVRFIHAGPSLRVSGVRVASRAWCLQAAAMLACPAVFKMPMARWRRMAMAWGPLPCIL